MLCLVPFPQTPRLPWNKDLNNFAKEFQAEYTQLPRPNSDLQWSVPSLLLFNLNACKTELTYNRKVTPRNTATPSFLKIRILICHFLLAQRASFSFPFFLSFPLPLLSQCFSLSDSSQLFMLSSITQIKCHNTDKCSTRKTLF